MRDVTAVITDIDNTLYDWMAMWVPAFDGMLTRLAADSGVPREQLEREFSVVHQRHGTTEYAFAIQELPSLVALHPGEDLVVRYASAIAAYRTARRQTLRTPSKTRRSCICSRSTFSSWKSGRPTSKARTKSISATW